MASGNSMASFLPQANQPPVANFATLDLRNGHPVLDFDAAVAEDAVFSGILPRHYAGGGLTVTIIWAASSATTGNCTWQAAIERNEAGGTDLDADSFATAQTATGAAPGASGALQYTTVLFTAGAQMDSLVAGEAFRLKISRDAVNGADTMLGDAELRGVHVHET